MLVPLSGQWFCSANIYFACSVLDNKLNENDLRFVSHINFTCFSLKFVSYFFNICSIVTSMRCFQVLFILRSSQNVDCIFLVANEIIFYMVVTLLLGMTLVVSVTYVLYLINSHKIFKDNKRLRRLLKWYCSKLEFMRILHFIF